MRKKKRNAPEATVTLSDGTHKQLSDFWQQQKLVLVFVRHFG